MNNFISGGKAIPCELFVPTSAGKHPAVVVAYGTEAMGRFLGYDAGAAIRDFATFLTGEGLLAAVPHYFARTDTAPGFETVMPALLKHRDIWIETLEDCVRDVVARNDVDPSKVGLLGFSLGGHLVLRQAIAARGYAIDAVVEFFAPISLVGGLGSNVSNLPPVQIHHGTADEVVKISESDGLERSLKAAGKKSGTDYERLDYAGEGHGFRAPAAIVRSRKATVDFFKLHLA